VKAPVCPECEAPLEIVADGMVGEHVVGAAHDRGAAPRLRWKRAPFGACPTCEFCIEITVRKF